ncbi:MAG: metallophosphoesterase family protein, partial [Acidimicrobiia bacterium]
MPAAVALIAANLAWSTGGPRSAVAAADPVLLAAGDVAQCSQAGDEQTGGLIQHQLGIDPSATVAMLGDGAYPQGDLATYQQCYDPSWGVFKASTRPTPGNHDYAVGPNRQSAPGYFDYFGAAAGDPTQGFYSYDRGAWHIVSLNSSCAAPGAGCSPGDPQLQWLENDLATHPGNCIAAYWHHPRFFSLQKTPSAGVTAPSSDTSMSAIWDILQAHGADVVINGHIHAFETFPRQDSAGNLADAGMREFVVGTGGGPPDTYDPDHLAAHSESRHDHLEGLLKLTLHADGFDWSFVAAGAGPAGTVVESGHDACAPVAPVTTVPTVPTLTTPPAPATGPLGRSGYWMLDSDGHVFAFGDAPAMGDAPVGSARAVDLEPTPSGEGYRVIDDRGHVFAFGDVEPLGDVGRARLQAGETVTSLSSTPSGRGYWAFTTRGRVLPFGDAGDFGDTAGSVLNAPVLDSVSTPSGQGYYMVASDGGIFAFGDARFAGSMGGKPLNAPMQSLVPDPDGSGYWLVASDGGVFAFDAPFWGSMGGRLLNRPVTGMVPFGSGYLMVGEDGGIFNFS